MKKLLIAAAMALSTGLVLAQETNSVSTNSLSKPKSILDYAKKLEWDVFNQRISKEERNNPKPKRGGNINVRIPAQPKSFNVLTENDAQVGMIFGYVSDSLVIRDPETFERLPWIAKYWKESDLVILKDDTRIMGKITTEDEKGVTIVPGGGKVTIGKFDIKERDEANGIITLNTGETFKGKATDLNYTVQIELVGDGEAKVISKDELKEQERQLGDQKEIRKASKKNVIYVFHLRDGVKWHDGKELSVEDYLFGYETLMNTHVDAAPRRSGYVDVETVTSPDANQLQVVMQWPYFAGIGIADITPLPRHRYEFAKFKGDPEGFGKYVNSHPDDEKPLGTGAYIFKQWNKGQTIVLQRNPEYWASQQNFPYWKPEQPYLDQITFHIINNRVASLKEMRNGKIDVDMDVEPDTWKDTNDTEFTSKFVRAMVVTPQYTYIAWNNDKPYFKDKKVRNALSHLIPTEKIGKDIHYDLVYRINGPFYLNGPVYDASAPLIDYNPAKGRKLLREAGWLDHDGDGIIDKDGIPLAFEFLIHNARDYHQKIADIIKESVEQVGIKMTIRKLDWSIFGDTVRDRKFDAVRFAWGSGIDDDPYSIWHSSQIKNGGNNNSGFSHPRVDELSVRAREEFDDIKRWEMLKQVDAIIREHQPYTFLFCFKELMFYNNRIRGVKLYPTASHGVNLMEWYLDTP